MYILTYILKQWLSENRATNHMTSSLVPSLISHMKSATLFKDLYLQRPDCWLAPAPFEQHFIGHTSI